MRPDDCQLFRMLKRERPKQNRMDDSENRRVRANAECEGYHGDSVEARMLQEYARRIAQILPHGVESHAASNLTGGFSQMSSVAEPSQGVFARLLLDRKSVV